MLRSVVLLYYVPFGYIYFTVNGSDSSYVTVTTLLVVTMIV